MDSLFLQWIAMTDAYARRLDDALKGDPQALSDLKQMAADVQKQDSSFFTPPELESPGDWPDTGAAGS
jgi:hypothetical protein